jgi:geranylgeranyl diphosphate synthase type II
MSVDKINVRLEELMGEIKEPSLKEAMSHSLLTGGKRMRPLLLLAACEGASGVYDSDALDFACAIECIHTYSLVHDDLPAMDNDDLRRGKPTCHIVYGEAMAILAGDALLSHGIEVMARLCLKRPFLAAAMAQIVTAMGANGMIAGQVLDIYWENKLADKKALLDIQRKKTGALITASLQAGGMIGGADDNTIDTLTRLGDCIGLAFQIKDDILDVTATTDQLGKPVNSDDRNKKNTYVSVMGMEQAVKDYETLADNARNIIAEMDLKTDSLKNSVEELIKRKN